MRIAQHQKLQQELQVHQPAFALLEVEQRRIAAIQLGAHAPAHRRHVRAQRRLRARTRQHLRAQRLEIGGKRRIPGDRARAHQRLVLPGPGALALVVAEAGETGHQQALGAVRAQAHVHVEQTAGTGAHAQQRHQLLPQARIPARRVQAARAGGLRLRRGVVQEHQVEVGAEAQLLAAQGAVAEHREAAVGNAAVRRFQFIAGQAQHAGHHRIGQMRQPARAVLRVDAAVQQRQREAEAERLPHLVERIQRRLGVVRAQHRRAGRAHRVGVRQLAAHAHVQQFVQQQRIGGQALAQQGAARQRVHQPRQRRRLLVEQGQVAGAAQDRLQQRQHPPHHCLRLRAGGRLRQQRRQHPVQPRARGIRQIAHAGAAREIAQAGMQLLGRLREAGRRQRLGARMLRQRPPVGRQAVALRAAAAPARGQQRGELLAHPRALRGQRRPQRRPIRIAQAAGDPRLRQRIRGQRIGLGIAQHLQAVLQPAQKTVGLRQRRCGFGLHVPGGGQRLQRVEQAAPAQRRLAPAADQLQRLHQEFDLADAAGAALDVIGQVLARHLGGDHRLHRAQAFQRAVVEVAAIDERPQRLQQARAGIEIARHRARLLPGVALPIAALALEIGLHRGERQRDAAGAAERAQA